MSLFERTLEFSGFPFKKAEQDYLQIQSLGPEAFDRWQLCKRLHMVKDLDSRVFGLMGLSSL